jgi:hypothetical protein
METLDADPLRVLRKVEPITAIRDELMETHEKTRVILSHQLERILQNHFLGDYEKEEARYQDILFEKARERYRHFVAKGGRAGHIFHVLPGMRGLLGDAEFSKRHQLATWDGRTKRKMYLLDKDDFGPMPCNDDDEEALSRTGGGKVRRTAFQRVFANVKGPELDAQWALDDKGRPEQEAVPVPSRPVGELVTRAP